MSKKETRLRYGEGCIRVTFPAEQPNAAFLVRGLHDMSDVDLEGEISGHQDAAYAYKAQAREAARSFAFEELMRMMKRGK